VTPHQDKALPSGNPKAAFLAHEAAIREAFDRVMLSGSYVLGPELAAFEAAFANYLGGGFVTGVGNGTEAIEIALRAAGVRPGDMVATVANTVSATVAAIEQIGAVPVLVEIEHDTMVMSPDALDECLALHRDRIRAVVPVHLYGNCADMPRIIEICAAHDARVVEDCAQSHGATIGGRKAGSFGDLAAFSFYPTKNLGAMGDGGGIFTRSSELDEDVRLLRQYGWRTRYVSEIPGRNSRLDEFQAAVLNVKLPALDEANAYRRQIAQWYTAKLRDSRITLPVAREGVDHVYHQYAIRIQGRDRVREALGHEGIACVPLYPVPIHHQPAYLDLSISLPVSEKACAEILCLPCYPGLEMEDVDRVCERLLAHLD
jgi:dTDP-4-amino-4,6-dideoxygalactose transaminase